VVSGWGHRRAMLGVWCSVHKSDGLSILQQCKDLFLMKKNQIPKGEVGSNAAKHFFATSETADLKVSRRSKILQTSEHML